jgi:hypothetical protein
LHHRQEWDTWNGYGGYGELLIELTPQDVFKVMKHESLEGELEGFLQ